MEKASQLKASSKTQHTGTCLSPEWGALSTVLMNADGRAASHPAKLPVKMSILLSGLREAQKEGVTLLMLRRSPVSPVLTESIPGVGLVVVGLDCIP